MLRRVELDDLRRTWDRFGVDDPLWAVLTSPDKKNGRWDVAEFFETGRFEIDRVLAAATTVAGQPPTGGRALDFGCGVGRLSQALAERFARVDGVDIAPSMIQRARTMNRHGARCVYHLNAASDLELFGADEFDFAYSAHVLQHMEPRFARGYVGELVRVLRPGGVLVFQLPIEPRCGATEALVAAAYRAELEVLDWPARMRPGARGTVRVTVRNASDHTFPAAGRDGWFLVTAGNHWSQPGTPWAQVDDARVRLPYDLEPGAQVTLELEVTAPAAPGRHVLSVDLCQEGVAWFASRGSVPAEVAVEVTTRRPRWMRRRASPDARIAGRADEPQMEMYGSPVDEVTGWVESAGGAVLDVLDWDALVDQRPSPDWVRRCFVATKPPRG